MDSGSYPLCDRKNRPGCLKCERDLEVETEGGAKSASPVSGDITTESGIKYHINDTVFYIPSGSGKDVKGRLRLGIIVEFLPARAESSQELKIRKVDRVDSLQSRSIKDEREVSLSSIAAKIFSHQLQGRFELHNIKELGLPYSDNLGKRGGYDRRQSVQQSELLLAQDRLEREKNPLFFWSEDEVENEVCSDCYAEVRERWRQDENVRNLVKKNPTAFEIGSKQSPFLSYFSKLI